MAKHNRAFQLLKAAMRHFDLSGSEIKVLLAWMDHAPDFHPSTSHLGVETNLKRNHVSTAIQGLIRKQVLRKDGKSNLGITRYEVSPLLLTYLGSPNELKSLSVLDELDAIMERQRRDQI